MRAIRWSDNDRYFGPFTYSRDSRHYRPFAIMLGSGREEYEGCRLRLSAFGHTLNIALPALIKPYRQRHEIMSEPMRSQMIAAGRQPGYWDEHAREFGFSAIEGALHIHYGPQTHDSCTTKSRCWFYPWKKRRHVRHSLYDLEGEHFADLPEWGFRFKNGWAVRNAIEDVCPVAKFDFEDLDGERITATTKIEERQWKLGVRWFKWLSLIWPDAVRRSLDLQFSSEVVKRKGSWKGGTIGHSIDMLPGELHEAAFRRYCAQQGLTFVGAANPETIEA